MVLLAESKTNGLMTMALGMEETGNSVPVLNLRLHIFCSDNIGQLIS